MTAVENTGFAHGVETPLPLAPTQNYFQLLGWAHYPASDHPCPLRVVVGDRTFEPVERFERRDVADLYPDDAGARESGFKFLGYLPFGFYTGSLEASPDGGTTWTRLRTLSIPVSAHPLQGAVESPRPDQTVTSPARVEGWVHHPEFIIREVVLQYGNIEVPCEYGLARPDVAEGLANRPGAGRTGFISTENLPRGSGTVKIRALTTCGRIFFLDTTLQVDLASGWGAKPAPPSPSPDLSKAAWPVPPQAPVGRRDADGLLPAGERNILFVLHGDFGANSALHVAALANQLIERGYDCVVAVPINKATLGSLYAPRFVAAEFSEVDRIGTYFKDGKGPCVTHAWTPRERVRDFCDRLAGNYATTVLVHLEDNEFEIAAKLLDCGPAEISAVARSRSDDDFPPGAMHPERGPAFMASAAGITLIVDELSDHAPKSVPQLTFWPAADGAVFSPRPRDDDRRAALAIPADSIVLFYHGNVHAANAGEVGELYRAVDQLNAAGRPALLLRAGRDDHPVNDGAPTPHVVNLGFVENQSYLPVLMAAADYLVQPGAPDDFNNYRFPSKLPEFFSLGRPVIVPASNVGRVLRHGEDAWVLPVADAPAIVAAVAHLQDHPDTAARLATGALAFAEKHFSWSQSADQLITFYQSLTPLAAPSTLFA